MNPTLAAIVWLLVYAATLGGLLFALTRRSKRIIATAEALRRRTPNTALSLLADLHVRRALWFSMLDNMYERYTLLLETARHRKPM